MSAAVAAGWARRRWRKRRTRRARRLGLSMSVLTTRTRVYLHGIVCSRCGACVCVCTCMCSCVVVGGRASAISGAVFVGGRTCLSAVGRAPLMARIVRHALVQWVSGSMLRLRVQGLGLGSGFRHALVQWVSGSML